MDALLSLLNTPRLQPGDYKELTKTIKKVLITLCCSFTRDSV
jgi:hypothetical protein